MKYTKKYPLLFVLIIATILRLVNINQSFWLDEAAQVIESARPLSQQLQIAADFHPPGFHLLLYIWMLFGHSEIWIRLLPLGFGLASIFLLYHISKELGLSKFATVASLLLAISPYHIWYSQETRPYSFFVFTSLLATYMLVRRRWVGYCLSVMMLLYSLYFAPFVLLGHITYIVVCDTKSWKKFFLSLMAGCLTFIPWITSFLEQLRIGTGGAFSGWTSVVSVLPVKAVPLTIAKFLFGRGTFENKFVYATAITPGVITVLISLLFAWKSKKYRSLFILFLIPLLAAMSVSLIVPVIAPQRLIFLLPIFLLLIVAGLDRFPASYRDIGIGVLVLTSIVGLIQLYNDPNVRREQWREAVTYIENNSFHSIALFAFPEPFAPYYWYTSGKVPGYGYAKKFIVNEQDLTDLAHITDDKNRIFLFQYLSGLTDPDNKIARTLMYSGYSQTDIKNFPGVGFVYIYDKK